MPDAMIHLICGPTGAGKTTHALALCDRIGAVRFSIDEWMTTLFWQDSPQPLEIAWTMERIARCEAMIWKMCLQTAARGVPCVLDLGFTRADHRAKFATLAKDAGLKAALHLADAPAAERWQRVQGRNADKGATFQLHVTREMFDFMEGIWQSPTPEEFVAIAMQEPLSP